MTLPSEMLAFKLFKQANFNNEKRLLVLTGIGYTMKNELHEQAKLSLKKFEGDQVTEVANSTKSMTLESVCVADEIHLQTTNVNKATMVVANKVVKEHVFE